MTGTIKIISIIFLLIFVTGCSTYCTADFSCKKRVDYNDPMFSLLRTIVTNGASAGK